MEIHRAASVEQVNEAFIQYFLPLAKQAIATKGKFNWVLTGGNSPRAVYQQLATDYAHEIEWDKVYFFFGDERYVSPTNVNYNGKMAQDCLFTPLSIGPNQIFNIPTQNNPEEDALLYQQQIDAHFGIQNEVERAYIQFDLIMLGMGEDAHTASLFPYTNAISASKPEIIAVWVEKLNTHRITFSAPLINQAHQVAFFCFGKNKSHALAQVWDNTIDDVELYPSKLIQPKPGELHWFVDNEALKLIK
ncbi:MAG: 6-phosphogluconolactonase [Pedobacter sp.]|nr:MAG: 6-phosphogluconolactonase [Pedobacter sp.]